MKAILHFNTSIQFTFQQLTELAKQLPKKERLKLVAILQEEDEPSKEEILNNIRQGFEEMQLIKEGKLKTKPLTDFLNGL
jgi:hypothetical protein